MAQRLILIDDLDESEGAETITYTVNGQDYEIDLSEENAQGFYDVLGPYIEKSRRVQRQAASPSRRDGRRRSSSSSGRDDIPQIRAWAEANGHEVNGRGRIKKDVIDAYDQAHQ
jgi:Lsr2